MSPALAIRLVAREARGSAIRVTFFIACLSVGVAAVVAVSGMSSGIDRAIRAEAKPLLAADVAVSSESPIPQAVLDAVAALARGRADVRVVGLRELATVVSVPGDGGEPGASALVLLKAFEAGYPLYGALVTDPPREAGASLDAAGALVAPELASKLHLREGSVLRIGGEPAKIECHWVTNDSYPVTGLGEPSVPPLFPALANAIAKATGRRLRTLPMRIA